jgi:hypothetical protein
MPNYGTGVKNFLGKKWFEIKNTVEIKDVVLFPHREEYVGPHVFFFHRTIF